MSAVYELATWAAILILGVGGVAIFLQAVTDNKNRTVSEIRHIFQKSGGQLSEKGSVAWMFKRMGYIDVEKLDIAVKHLVPKQRKATGLDDLDIRIGEPALRVILDEYTREAGVRQLERELASCCRKIARRVVQQDMRELDVTPELVRELLGVPRFRTGKREEQDQIGLATGLAWTQVGGELLGSEVTVMAGKGKLITTGALGNIMQESAQAAMSYVRSRAASLGLPRDFYQSIDVHIHVPEGATPKDGPSAGITLATALVSALTRIPGKAASRRRASCLISSCVRARSASCRRPT